MVGKRVNQLTAALLGRMDPDELSDTIEEMAQEAEQSPSMESLIQGVKSNIQSQPLPEGATRYALKKGSTGYNGLDGLEIVELADYPGDPTPEFMDALKKHMGVDANEILVVVNRHGTCFLAKVNPELLIELISGLSREEVLKQRAEMQKKLAVVDIRETHKKKVTRKIKKPAAKKKATEKTQETGKKVARRKKADRQRKKK